MIKTEVYSMFTTLKIYGAILRHYLIYLKLVTRNSPRLKPGFFEFQGHHYQYFYHPHNHTWDNERAVELPLVINEILKKPQAQVLEVGNVLQHYIPITHDVVDKYEIGPHVINVDIVDFQPKKKYDLIVSISTLEHVGWDENPHTLKNIGETKKVAAAILKLSSLLKKQGRFFITVPLGYNSTLDKLLSKHDLKADSIYYLKRQDVHNRWQEIPAAKAKRIKYGTPYENANGLAVLVLTKKS